MTNPIDKAQLRALAEAATPGPWFSVSRGQYWGEDEGEVRDVDDQDVVGAEFVKPIGDVDTTRGQAWRRDTDFIAAANPATIIALLDEVEALRAEAARVGGYFIPLNSTDPFADEVQVQRMRQMEGPPKWAAKLNGRCLNKSGGWEWEPMPSSRDDEFLARCRFDTAAEAIAAVHASMKEKTP